MHLRHTIRQEPENDLLTFESYSSQGTSTSPANERHHIHARAGKQHRETRADRSGGSMALTGCNFSPHKVVRRTYCSFLADLALITTARTVDSDRQRWMRRCFLEYFCSHRYCIACQVPPPTWLFTNTKNFRATSMGGTWCSLISGRGTGKCSSCRYRLDRIARDLLFRHQLRCARIYTTNLTDQCLRLAAEKQSGDRDFGCLTFQSSLREDCCGSWAF